MSAWEASKGVRPLSRIFYPLTVGPPFGVDQTGPGGSGSEDDRRRAAQVPVTTLTSFLSAPSLGSLPSVRSTVDRQLKNNLHYTNTYEYIVNASFHFK